MDQVELRKYLDIINENSEEVLTEGMLQKLAGLALGTVLALGPKIGQADTVYTYFDPGTNKMQTVLDMSKVPASAKTVMSVDTDTQQVMLVRSGSPTAKEITPDPVAVKQAQFSKDTKSFSDEPQKSKSQAQQTPSQELKIGTVYENNDWTAKYDKDAMSDKPSCTIFSKKNRHVQVNVEADGSGTFYDSFKGRGGLKKISYGRYGSYMPIKYRLDNDPAKEFTPTGAAAEIQVIALPLSELQGKSKITIQVFTVLDEVVTDSIDLNSLNPAVSKCVQAMNQK